MMDTVFKHKAPSCMAFSGLPAWIAGASIFLAGCASNPPAPTAQMAVSNAALAQAVSADAPELAPAEMRSARDKMARANVAMNAKDYELARLLAEQAQADAQLAVTKARSVKAQKAAAAVQEDSRVLREEINRKAN